MRVLSIGTDRKLFEEKSAVLTRSIEYAKRVGEMHLIVFSLSKDNLQNKRIGNLFLYPTNSKSKLRYISDAVNIGRKILGNGNLSDFVISTQDPFETGLVGRRLKKIFGVPLQIQVHTDFVNPFFRNTILNFVRVSISNFTISKADRIRVVSVNIKDSLVKNFGYPETQIDVLPIFVDIEKIFYAKTVFDVKKEYPQFRNIIFMASRLEREKRIDVALRAFKEVVKIFPNTGLVIAGSGSQKKLLEKMVTSMKLNHKVVFVGWQNDLVSYYKSSDIFLLTSEYEGYGMTLIEAWASGTPIVTTKVGVAGTPLFVDGENSFVCKVGDYKKIALSLIELLKNQTKRDLFKRQMQDTIKGGFVSIGQYSDKYVNILQKCLKNI